MVRIRAVAAAAAALLLATLAACVATPPPVADEPVVSVVATQTAGPLGDGTTGIERTDATSLAELEEVLALPDTEREDIECAWSTRTTLELTYSNGTTETVAADSCGATGRGEAIGLLVARWAEEG